MKEYPKECPFCHALPDIVKKPLKYFCRNYDYYIACQNKDYKIQPRTRAYNDIYDMTEQECIDKAIEDWNDR